MLPSDLDEVTRGPFSKLATAALRQACAVRDGTPGTPAEKARAVKMWFENQQARLAAGQKLDIEALAEEEA